MTGSNVESNGKRPGVRLNAAACQADTASREFAAPAHCWGAGKLGRGLAQPSDTPRYDCLKPY